MNACFTRSEGSAAMHQTALSPPRIACCVAVEIDEHASVRATNPARARMARTMRIRPTHHYSKGPLCARARVRTHHPKITPTSLSHNKQPSSQQRVCGCFGMRLCGADNSCDRDETNGL